MTAPLFCYLTVKIWKWNIYGLTISRDIIDFICLIAMVLGLKLNKKYNLTYTGLNKLALQDWYKII